MDFHTLSDILIAFLDRLSVEDMRSIETAFRSWAIDPRGIDTLEEARLKFRGEVFCAIVNMPQEDRLSLSDLIKKAAI